jgi:nucleoside-diphosphate-sugar epimerase
MSHPQTVLVTGGAGYVGGVLVPKLLARGHRARVLDLYLYGEDVLAPWRGPRLEEVRGDLRDRELLARALTGCDAVIHLACVSNDPSFELDPELGRSINYDGFLGLLDLAKKKDVPRFIFASTSSVYGIKEEEDVTEDLSLEPLTDYSKYKVMCEEALLAEDPRGFTPVIIRPATVCGHSPRLRLDLTVNILTNHAVNSGRITVFGGSQRRPNIHIADIADLYTILLELPDERIHRKVYNAGYENHTVSELAAP